MFKDPENKSVKCENETYEGKRNVKRQIDKGGIDMQYKHTEAYNSIKAPTNIKEQVLASAGKKSTFDCKPLIYAAACVIILISAIPTYWGFTNPQIAVKHEDRIIARQIGTTLTVELDLKRSTIIEVSHGTLDGYDGNKLKGKAELVWDIGITDYRDCTLKLKDDFGTTEYVLNYEENNGSWSIIKN